MWIPMLLLAFTLRAYAEEQNHLQLTFTNLNEANYVYNFNPMTTVSHRAGIYSILFSGLDDYPAQLRLTQF